MHPQFSFSLASVIFVETSWEIILLSQVPQTETVIGMSVALSESGVKMYCNIFH